MGYYQINNGSTWSNGPGNYSYGTVEFMRGDNHNYQMYRSHTASNGDGLRYRTGWSNSWYSWRMIWDTATLTNLSQLSNGPSFVTSGSSPTFQEVYVNGWFRNNTAGNGLYNQSTGNHWYSNGSYWDTGQSGTGGIRLRNGHQGQILGYFYGDTSLNSGLLDYPGNWRIRTNNGYQELYGTTYMNDARWYIGYSRDDTSYYVDMNTWSRMWGIGTFYLRNNYDVSTNHEFGVAFSNDQSTAYRIYREGGGWSYPYPDLRIAFHTGLKFGANPSYEGMRFYTDYDMSSRVMQINGSSNYIWIDRWMNVSGHQGIYSDTNGAHIYPNNGDYGSWRMDGTRNGWYGIYFASGSTLMMNDGDGGIHRSGNGWRIYHSGNNLYARGEVTAYWSDRRLKQNIKPLEPGSGLALVDRLVPSSFEWNAQAVKINEEFYEGQPETALIAQEVQEVLPIAVAENKAGRSAGKDSDIESYLTVKYDKITPYLIQAIKDLKAEIEELKGKINGSN
jgi:hypothetical protein